MKKIIEWFVVNPVAASLLMWVLIISGLLALPHIYQEEFPNVATNTIQVSVPYLGATPSEVEEAVCIRIEEAIEGSPGIKTIHSNANEGFCLVSIELTADANKSKSLDEIKSKVSTIESFPEQTEQATVSELTIYANVLQIVVSGNADERTLKILGQRLRDQLVDLSGVSQVNFRYVRPYELSIEISEQTLRRYGMTLDQVATIIRQNSLDLPGGTIKTKGGEILLRTKSQAYTAEEFENIVILTRHDGSNVSLGDIATVIDGFQDAELRARFDGNPAMVIEVRRVGNEDILDIAKKVKAQVANAQQTMPEGIALSIWRDESTELVERLQILSKNALGGLFLVLLILTLFLRPHVAFWVAAGIPISLMGTVMMFPTFSISISTVSVMGFIVVLGILVDDAIVVGERIYAYEQAGLSKIEAAVEGTYEVSVPVIFGVLTTMVTFTPIMFIPGTMGSMFSAIGATVLLALFFSILESQLILPSHLARHGVSKRSNKKSEQKQTSPGKWETLQNSLSNALQKTAFDYYQPALMVALRWRYLTATVAVCIVALVICMFASGRIVFEFFPSVDGDRVYASLTLPDGTNIESTEAAVQLLELSAEKLRKELDQDLAPGQTSKIKHILSSVGAQLAKSTFSKGDTQGSHFAEVAIELDLPPEYTGMSPSQIAARWRKLTGNIPDAVELTFSAAFFTAGKAIDIQLRGPDYTQLKHATAIVREQLQRYDGVFDITDSYRDGKQEVQLSLLPEARNLGLTQQDLALQVRQAFYGEEVQRLQRNKDDVRVMVRFPKENRRSMGDLETMRIRTSEGIEVPFSSVAEVTLSRGATSINRVDGNKVIHVMAEVDRQVTSPEKILMALEDTALKDIKRQFPDIDLSLAGEAEERAEALGGIIRTALMALLVIYALLAIPLKSYLQPLVIMSAIPFGAVGAILGHYILGWQLVFFSIIGIVALSGVVVNASLVLVDYINRQRDLGKPVFDAVRHSGAVRFRPIVLTSVTTFVGLVPLIATSSFATHLFVPLAISLAFGILFATSVTLFLVPCLYLILEDMLTLGKGTDSLDVA